MHFFNVLEKKCCRCRDEFLKNLPLPRRCHDEFLKNLPLPCRCRDEFLKTCLCRTATGVIY
jgi:hypothetical protein